MGAQRKTLWTRALLAGWLALQAAGPAAAKDPQQIRPLEVTATMKGWAHAQVPQGPPRQRLRALLEALVATDGLGLVEQSDKTGTAAEVFSSRRANCAGFAYLFVALARSLDLPAYFVLYPQVERYGQTPGLRIANLHLAAAFGPPEDRRLYDLGGETEAARLPAEIAPYPVSDETALAIFYSNRGAETLEEDEERAFAALQRALALDPDLPAAWINFGVALRRGGRLGEAEAAYRHAIDLEPDSLSAWRNLALVLLRRLELRETETAAP